MENKLEEILRPKMIKQEEKKLDKQKDKQNDKQNDKQIDENEIEDTKLKLYNVIINFKLYF